MCLGIPGQITAIKDHETLTAIATVSGIQRDVNMACVVGQQPVDSLIGSWVLIHVGFAMSIIDEEEATKTLAILDELGELEAELASMREDHTQESPA